MASFACSLAGSPGKADRRTEWNCLRWLAPLTLGAISLGAVPASAACVFVPTVGDDAFICDSGTSAGGLSDLNGNNSLTFPAGGTGTLNGNVAFGGGTDSVDMNSGTIIGTVNLGAGADSFVISAGSVTGNVQQGSGTDDFRMTGGIVQSLSQGDNIDTFFMSDGRIVGFFEDGDRAIMTGGRIGRVDMKLDDNLFDMSGGAIDGNLVAGFGNDTIILSDGTIGGNISVSGGTDRVTITGGSVGGNVLMSFGSDTFTWQDGGTVFGSVDLGPDNDTATLRNLSNGNLGAVTAFNGNTGTDTLTLNNVSSGGVARLRGWETINATNDTELTFDGTLTLGDAGTGTGSLRIDAASTVFGGGADGRVSPFTDGALVNVINSGRIDLTNGGANPGDSLRIDGNYSGNNGLLFVDTQLGNDSSLSDRLVISAGTADGFTGLGVINSGGTGDLTVGNGILVVQALNGATTGQGTFALTGPVAAGAYEYLLFKGGVSTGTDENWYLRSALVQPEPGPTPTAGPVAAPTEPPLEPASGPQPEPADPEPPVAPPDTPGVDPPTVAAPDPPPTTPTPVVQPAIVPDPARPNQPPPTPDATPVIAPVVSLYRIEVPVYSAVPPLAHTMGLASLGEFHERRGEQSLLDTTGTLPAAWGRVYGQDSDIKWSGTVAPSFDGSVTGFQAGLDLFGFSSFAEHTDRVGFFVGRTSAGGDVQGQALGWNDLDVGRIDLDATSVAGYWTHIGPQGWYLDAVLMGTWVDGEATSTRAVGIEVEGTGVTASLEGGYPIPLTQDLTFEPQAQLIWQRFDFDDEADSFSTVSFDEDSSLTGRLGFRLQASLPVGAAIIKPYAKANLWHGFTGSQSVIFGTTAISTETDSTALELGGGLVAELSKMVSFHATADYTFNLNGEDQRVTEGSLGLTISW